MNAQRIQANIKTPQGFRHKASFIRTFDDSCSYVYHLFKKDLPGITWEREEIQDLIDACTETPYSSSAPGQAYVKRATFRQSRNYILISQAQGMDI